jgi:hypothetical protein
VRNSDAQVPFTIKVIDSDVVNAMALPGGFFYVNSGLILQPTKRRRWPALWPTRSHVAACHAAREQTRASLPPDGFDSVHFCRRHRGMPAMKQWESAGCSGS